MCAYFATRIPYFFCSLNCFKKILNVKTLKWKFCRKTCILSSIWPQSPAPNSSALSAHSQVQLLLVGDQCKMVAIKHQPENTRPPCDLEMSYVGGFGPNRLVSTPSDNEPVHPLPRAAFDFAFHVTRSKAHSTTWHKIRPTICIHPLWTSAGTLVMVTLE